MRFKFILAIALILCAFCVLPISAYNVDLSLNDWTNDTVITLPSDTLNFGFSAYRIYLSQERFQPYTVRLSSNEGGVIYCPAILPEGNPPWIQYGSSFVPNLGIGTHTIVFTGIVNNKHIQLTFTYTITENYNPAPDAVINADLIGLTDTTVTYDVYCLPEDGYLFTPISGEEQGLNSIPYLTSAETHKTFVIGEIGGTVYSIASTNEYGAQRKQISLYLNGTTEQPIIPPTPTPTDTPVYPDRITGYIQTYDANSGNMLSGVNLSVYEVIDHDTYAELGQLIYSSINAESQTVLQLKNNTDYFVKNELIGYLAIKNTNYWYFGNITGYWWANPAQGFNPLLLYYSKLDPTAQYDANFIVHDVYQNGIAGVSVTMDNSKTLITNNIGGVSFKNVSAGPHTFVFVKNGYQSAQRTIDIQYQFASFDQVLFKDNQIIQPTVSPTAYPTTYPTVSPTAQPTLSPIDKPSNIMESVSFGFAKIFGIKTVENANYIFALMLILFPAVIAGSITRQALGFIAGGMVGFVFALAVGLVPIWVFFAMCLMAVIYIVLKGGNEGF